MSSANQIGYKASTFTRFTDVGTYLDASRVSVSSPLYNFTAQFPGGSLVVGSNTIALNPVPPGVNGSDGQHYLYISGGLGTAEAVLITGGTAVSDSSSGTVSFTCANTHSGAWSISSASGGIKEASVSNPSGTIYIPAGTINIRATLVLPTTVSLIGQGASTANPVTMGTILSCSASANPALVLADGSGSAAGQGIGYHSGYTLVSPGGTGSGLWLGGDPSNVFAPSAWFGSYIHFESVVTNFVTGITVANGNFVVFSGGASNSITTALYIPSTNDGSQPLEFSNFLLSVSEGGNAVVMDWSGFVTCMVHFAGGQISGTITGAQVSWDSEGTHYEPNGAGRIVNISANGSHRFRASGGLMSVHGTGTLDAMVKVSGTGIYEVNLSDILIQADVGHTVTDFVSFTSSSGGTLIISGIEIQPAGTISRLYSTSGQLGLYVMHSKYSVTQGVTAAATTVFPESNYPTRGLIEIQGATVGGGGITAVSGLINGQTGILYSDNVQTFTAGATIGFTLTTVANAVYTYNFHSNVFWIK